MTDKQELSDDKKQDILKLIQTECARAIGFDNVNAGELVEQREKALNYLKGDMPDLIMNLQGRSKFVSTDVADTIDAAMPDLVDIFTGSDDVVAFEPVSEEDVKAAKQEGDYLRYVVYNKNPGWKVVHNVFKDALTCKTGIFGWRWEGEYEPPVEYHEGKNILEVLKAKGDGALENVEHHVDEGGQTVFSYEFTPKNAKGRMVVFAVAPEDLAVAGDTESLATATYCSVRSRPRAQELIAIGYDQDAVDTLPPWNNTSNQPEQYARDTVDESQITGTSPSVLRQVEIYRHYIRLYDEDEKRFCLYHVVTGGKGYTTNLIHMEEVSRVQLAAITPYINPHRFYGDSIADKTMPIQKVKSSLIRMALDAGYFALNQRMEVADDGVNDYTIDDLLNNEPGRPIRVRRTGTVTPVVSGGLDYDPLQHLEFFAVENEKRTGIMRTGPGLNADTLHDTKGGLELIDNNQLKRLRFIARTFAETGYKDFLVNLHADIRENGASMKDTIRLRNDWVDIDPSTWRQREDMTIQIGVGAGGREHDLVMSQLLAGVQEKCVEAQQLPPGPLVDYDKIYASAIWTLDKAGFKSPESFIADPKKYQPPDQKDPPPDPALVKVQQDGQIAQAQMQMDAQHAEQSAQLEQAKAQSEHDAKQTDAELMAHQIQTEDSYKRDQAAAELQLKRDQLAEEARLKQYEIDANIALQREQMAHDWAKHTAKLENDTKIASSVRVGGEPG